MVILKDNIGSIIEEIVSMCIKELSCAVVITQVAYVLASNNITVST